MALPGMLAQLAKASPMMGQIKQAMNTVRMAQNPMAMLNQMAGNNPLIRQAMDLVNQHGGDVDKAFRTVAEQNGFIHRGENR